MRPEESASPSVDDVTDSQHDGAGASMLEYSAPRVVELGDAAKLVRSMSYGGYLDGDSNPDFRHKPA